MKCPRCQTSNNVMSKFCSACGLPMSIELSSLRTLSNDRYRIDRQIGKGGMGIVLKGLDTLRERQIAIKMLLTDAMKGENINRFRREFQAMKKLHHKNIVSVYDFLEHDVYCFYIMEFVDGRSMRELFESEPLEGSDERVYAKRFSRLMKYLCQICDGLDFIHQQGFIHRDIKPSNIMITEDDRVKLMDFGLVKSRDFSISLTRTGIISGTVAYMSPEQAMGKNLDLRTDLYSLGVVMYELLTGSLPFFDENPINLLIKTINNPPPTPSKTTASISAELDRIILKCLHKDPQLRFPHARALKECLLNLGSEDHVEPTTVLEVQRPVISTSVRHLLQPRFSGRKEARDKLMSLLDQVNSGDGQIVFLHGMRGIGKTRLIEELKHEAVTRNLRFFHGIAYPQQDTPYKPFTDMVEQFAHYASLYDSGAASELENSEMLPLQRIVSAVSRPVEASRTDNLEVQQFLREGRNRIFEIFQRFFALLSGDSPLILFLDNAHQLDENSFHLFLFLARNIHRSKILMIAAARDSVKEDDDEDKEQDRNLVEAMTEHQIDWHEMPLGHLLEADITSIVCSMLGIESIAEPTAAYIYRSSHGNPSLAQESLKNLIDEELFSYTDKGWQENRAIEAGKSGDLDKLLRARLGRLTPEQRKFLAMASVLGPTFDVPILFSLADVDEEQGAQLLRDLVQEEFIEEINDAAGDRYAFSHDDVCFHLYENFSDREKRKIHGKVLDRMRTKDEAQQQVVADRLFHHALKAEGNSITAAYYARIAGDRYVTQYALQTSRYFYAQALQILESLRLSTVTRMEIFTVHQSLARLNHFLGNPRDCIHHYFHALETAKKLKDSQLIAQCLLSIAVFYRSQQEFDKAVVSLEKTLALTEKINLVSEKAYALSLLGDVKSIQGHHDAAVESLSTALRLFRGLEEKEGEYQALIYYGKALSRRLDRGQALELFQLALDKAKENGHREFEWLALRAMISELLKAGELEKATSRASDAVALSTTNGTKSMQANAHLLAADCAQWQGNYPDAIQHYEGAMRIFEELDEIDHYLEARIQIGFCLSRLTEYTRVFGIIEDIYRHYSTHISAMIDLQLLSLLSHVYSETGLIHLLSSFSTKIDSHATNLQQAGNDYLVYRLCGDAWFSLGHHDAAKSSYIKALRDARDREWTLEELSIVSRLITTYLTIADLDKATTLFQQNKDLLETTKLSWPLCRIHFAFGLCHLAGNRMGEAKEYFEKAISISAECNFPYFFWRSSFALGQIHAAAGRENDAIPHFRDAQRVVQRIVSAMKPKYRKLYIQWSPVRDLLIEIDRLDRPDSRQRRI